MPLLTQFARFADSIEFSAYEPIDEAEVRAIEYATTEIDNAFLYYVQFNHAMFQSVIWRERMIMIASRKELNIVPPNIPYKKCLLEVIGKLEDSQLDFELSLEELECIQLLPNGWRLSELQSMTGYCSEPLPEINFEMFRLCWYLGAPDPIEAEQCMFIHPWHHRPLTGPEWEAIQAASGDKPLIGWLGSVASQATGPERPESPFPERKDSNRWVVDLRPLGTFPTLAIYPYPEPRKPSHLFNVNLDGSLRQPWNLISNRQHGTLTYGNSIMDSTADVETIEGS